MEHQKMNAAATPAHETEARPSLHPVPGSAIPSCAWWVTCSPHEWTWTQDQQAEMARACIRYSSALSEIEAIVSKPDYTNPEGMVRRLKDLLPNAKCSREAAERIKMEPNESKNQKPSARAGEPELATAPCSAPDPFLEKVEEICQLREHQRAFDHQVRQIVEERHPRQHGKVCRDIPSSEFRNDQETVHPEFPFGDKSPRQSSITPKTERRPASHPFSLRCSIYRRIRSMIRWPIYVFRGRGSCKSISRNIERSREGGDQTNE